MPAIVSTIEIGMQNKRVTDEDRDYYRVQEKFWKLLAPFYDSFVFFVSGFRQRVVDFTGASNGAKVLDVATGTGKQAFAFARRGYQVTGIDLSEDMLGVAIKKNKFKNLTLQTGDATSLPFEAEVFDVATVSFALHEMPLAIRETALREMVRVTRNDGIIVIVDLALPKNKLRRWFTYNMFHLVEGEHYAKFIRSDLKESIGKAGIRITEEVPVLFGAAVMIKGLIDENI